ncbi:hypothetical protein AB0G77_30470 [Streptomyces hygroscopicus]|uniref:hypothetical protein n=1 Tax=Streptomyces hygroscopicus TaxID=1912 RepID=UPI00340A547D
MARLVIGFGDDGEFRNDVQAQASESTTVVAGPGETVTVTTVHRAPEPDDND